MQTLSTLPALLTRTALPTLLTPLISAALPPSLRRAKKHVAGADEDYAREAATAPQDMGPTALEQARREYAADKRLALERRRARMMAEEGAARA